MAAVRGVISLMCRNGYLAPPPPPLPSPHRPLRDPQSLRTIGAVYSGPSQKSSQRVCGSVLVVCAELRTHSLSGGRPRGSRGALRCHDKVAVSLGEPDCLFLSNLWQAGSPRNGPGAPLERKPGGEVNTDGRTERARGCSQTPGF